MMKRMFQNIVEKILRTYRKRSIRFMISVSFSVSAVIAMLLVGVSLYLRFVAQVNTIIQEDNQNIIEQVNRNLDSYLRNMMKVSDSLYYDVIKNVDLTEESIYEEMNLLYQTNSSAIENIAVFDKDGELLEVVPLANLKPSINMKETLWFKNAMKKTENMNFSTPSVQNLFYTADYQYKWIISLSRTIEITKGKEIEQGVLLIDMKFSGIEQILDRAKLGNDGYVYLIDSDGEIIYHPRQQLIYSDIIKENNLIATTYKDGNCTEKFQGEERVITVKTVGYTGWKIIAVTPQKAIELNYIQTTVFAMLIIAFTIFIIVLLNIFISTRISDPIKELEQSVKKLENGYMDEDIYIGGSYEIEHLGKTIRKMVEQMKKLMNDVVNEHESKRKSELDALQSQINPHFLYNTLDAIVWMVENEKQSDAVRMVTSLARLFRISLSKGKNIIPVKDELEHVKNYLLIQQMRYKNKFKFEVNSQEEVNNLATIKLVIQPLVENAIYHGMEFMDGDGEITVTAFLKEEELYIEVRDNGLGMPKETVDKLLEDNHASKGTGSGIGLKNVQERIQLYFGEQYGLIIDSEPDEGTAITVHIPKRQMEEGGKV
ncbi:two-component system sensor histidine kinase YesM [Mobilisporobacter senegalensis]|uniref:histidine kinase n=1 Tax=Mobilisporobacter senegalensis TaxID=1329262 RepID=A0A3N1XYP3_9FIRM|nr:two-component system sensor histidine kinase YesM [Mobilisporobacter senegalensis]